MAASNDTRARSLGSIIRAVCRYLVSMARDKILAEGLERGSARTLEEHRALQESGRKEAERLLRRRGELSKAPSMSEYDTNSRLRVARVNQYMLKLAADGED